MGKKKKADIDKKGSQRNILSLQWKELKRVQREKKNTTN